MRWIFWGREEASVPDLRLPRLCGCPRRFFPAKTRLVIEVLPSGGHSCRAVTRAAACGGRGCGQQLGREKKSKERRGGKGKEKKRFKKKKTKQTRTPRSHAPNYLLALDSDKPGAAQTQAAGPGGHGPPHSSFVSFFSPCPVSEFLLVFFRLFFRALQGTKKQFRSGRRERGRPPPPSRCRCSCRSAQAERGGSAPTLWESEVERIQENKQCSVLSLHFLLFCSNFFLAGGGRIRAYEQLLKI